MINCVQKNPEPVTNTPVKKGGQDSEQRKLWEIAAPQKKRQHYLQSAMDSSSHPSQTQVPYTIHILYQHLLSLISVVEIFLCAFFFWFCLRGDVAWKHKRGPPFALFVPLIYAPILPISKFFIIIFLCSCFICHFFSLIWRFSISVSSDFLFFIFQFESRCGRIRF